MKIRPPVTFQGGKQRLAPAIVDAMQIDPSEPFADLCCGSGAITIEVVSRGTPASAVTMVDTSLWGDLWTEVGAGQFDLDTLRKRVDDFPTDLDLHAEHLQALHSEPIGADRSVVFLLLQAASFGGALILRPTEDRWQRWSPIKRWACTIPGQRNSRNSMMPHPSVIYQRMTVVCDLLLGVRAQVRDFTTTRHDGGCVYIDPPYFGTSGYGARTPVYDFVDFASHSKDARVWVSESRALGHHAVCMANGRKQGGMHGRRACLTEEWLTRIELHSGEYHA